MYKRYVYNAHDNTRIGRRSSHKSRDIHDGTEKKQVHWEILRIDNIMPGRRGTGEGREIRSGHCSRCRSGDKWTHANRYVLWRHYVCYFLFIFFVLWLYILVLIFTWKQQWENHNVPTICSIYIFIYRPKKKLLQIIIISRIFQCYFRICGLITI